MLLCPTPDAWLAAVNDHLPELLVDHANCEKKAASTALSLLYRYVEHPALIRRLSRLAREELRHFERVTEHLQQLGVAYGPLSASRYAARLRELVRPQEPHRLIDTLLVSAVVEARSCERFARLQEVLDEPLRGFYGDLLASEQRHFEEYLGFAERYASGPFTDKLDEILRTDQALVCEPDSAFRFHSGPVPNPS
jgi:tRNA-(ms[2]io[6]A)-hydroxylase